MKSVKIQQELIKNYANYVKKPSGRTKEMLPGCYSIANGRVNLVYTTHIFSIDEEDIFVDLTKFTAIENFRRDRVVAKYHMIEHVFPNAKTSGIVKGLDFCGIFKQGVEIKITWGGDEEIYKTYVDKKIFDYYECESFYFDDRIGPVYAIKNGTCIGMILPLAVNY